MGMDVGIWLGKSVVSERSRRSVSDIFLVENPTEAELAIKEKILANIQQSENDKLEKAKIKTIPLSKMEVGGIYEDINGSCFVFLGNCEYKKYQKHHSSEPVEHKSGYGFMWCLADGLTDDGANVKIQHSLQYERSFSFLKGNTVPPVIHSRRRENPLKRSSSTTEGISYFVLCTRAAQCGQ